MDISNNLKKKLLDTSGKPAIGSWFMSGSAHLAEAYGLCGFDFLVVDMEHAPIDIADAANILRAKPSLKPIKQLIFLGYSLESFSNLFSSFSSPLPSIIN